MLLVGLTGGIASGKSTVARNVAAALGDGRGLPVHGVDSLAATSYGSSVADRLAEWPVHTLTVVPFVYCSTGWYGRYVEPRLRSVQGMDRWLMALTPDGYPGPGTVSVLSVWVRPDLPARVALTENVCSSAALIA